MLPSKYRLTFVSFFSYIAFIQKLTTPLLSYRIKKTNNPAPPKVGFIVPKKLSKLSTKRNKTKRVLIETFLPLLPKLKPGVLILIYARKLLLKEKPKDLLPKITQDLDKISLL